MMPSIQHLIAIGIILFILRSILGLLGNISPVFMSLPAQIVTYFLAAIAFIFWLYRDSRSKHFNPHDVEIHTLAQKGQKKPEVWKMPDDDHHHPNKER